MKRFLFLFLLLSYISFLSRAQFSLTVATYSQDFDNLGIGSSTVAGGNLNLVNSSLNGWYFSESGTNADNVITAGTGSSNSGDTYNFGSVAATDRTLGGLQSGTLDPTYGFYFTNNTGSTITSLAISFTGEQWRLGATTRTDRIDFQYSLNATSLTTGIWVDVDALDFTAPVTGPTIGALDGNLAANQTAISNTLTGLSIVNGATIFIRWTDFNATGADDGLGVDNFSLTASFTGSSSDYFRSIASGSWDNISTWESSPDNSTWSPATVVPNSAANTISIRNGHSVTFSGFHSVDQVVIENGGVLNFSNGILTVEDGSGDDIDIQSGGIFTLSFAATPPSFGSGTPTINVSTGGMLRVSASGLTGAGTGVNTNNYVYNNQSILEYTLNGGFSTDNVVYFPNANAGTIPIFRTTNTSNLLVGANNPTTFNGIFECNGTGGITWQNSGNKIFRNGIRGSDNVSANVSAASAKFIINGTTAELGGAGSLTVPTAGGLEIGSASGTLVTVTANKTVTGDVSLISTGTYVDLGSNNLTVTGTIIGGGTNAFIKTSGTGVLTLGTVSTKIFPIGNTSYNPITISNGGGTNSFSTRVETGINPGPLLPTYGINRTWDIYASSVTSGVNVAFQYAASDANAGASPQPQAMEVLLYSGAWSIIAGNTNINPTGSNPYTVTTTTALTINNTSVPYALGKSGGWILPVDCIISCKAQKRNNTAIIYWNVNSCAEVNSFEIQRSVGNSGFQTIGTIRPGTNETNFSFTDLSLANGTNLYRIKVNRLSGASKYSNTVAVLYNSNDILITSLAPNPVHNSAIINLSAAKQTAVDFKVFDMSGRVVKQWKSNVVEGNNTISINVEGLPTGVYHVLASSSGAKAFSRVIKQ